jgi:hypothetical protein
MMYPYGGGPFGWGAAAFMGFFGLLVIVGIVLLIVWAARAGEHQHMHAGGPYYRLPQAGSSAARLTHPSHGRCRARSRRA